MKDDEPLALIDTNIIVYAYDETDKRKWKSASGLLEKVWKGEKKCAVSTQNLTEFYTIVTSKIEHPIPKEEAEDVVKDIIKSGTWKVIIPDTECLLDAIHIEREHAIHFWDAHIIAAAKKEKINLILTENVKDFSIPGVKAVNPLE